MKIYLCFQKQNKNTKEIKILKNIQDKRKPRNKVKHKEKNLRKQKYTKKKYIIIYKTKLDSDNKT